MTNSSVVLTAHRRRAAAEQWRRGP